MKYLFSRFGGHMMRIGHGKASNEQLPTDQSLDNMLDNFTEEVYPKCFVLSSYDLKPSFMGSMSKLPLNAVKVGTLHHVFNEIFLQYDVEVCTDIYLTYHEYKNVFAMLIKTRKKELNCIIDGYEETYDYVQCSFFREADSEERFKLSKNPKMMELMLYVLFYKMEITHQSFVFEPSKTHLGKSLSNEFLQTLSSFFSDIEDSKKLSEKLRSAFPSLLNNR